MQAFSTPSFPVASHCALWEGSGTCMDPLEWSLIWILHQDTGITSPIAKSKLGAEVWALPAIRRGVTTLMGDDKRDGLGKCGKAPPRVCR